MSTTKFGQALSLASILATSTLAFLREDPRPTNTSSMTISGSHTDHTTDEFGDFLHPFEQLSPDVQTIFYEESKTISTKIHRV